MPAIEDFISTTLKLQADANKQFERLSKLVLRIDRKEQYVLTRALSRLVRGHLAIFRLLRAHLHALAISKIAIPLPQPFESEFIEPETQSGLEQTAERASSPARVRQLKNESEDNFLSTGEIRWQRNEYPQEPMAHALALSTAIQSVTLAPMALQLSSRIQTEVMDRLTASSSVPSFEPARAMISGTSGVQYDKNNLEGFGISQNENSVSSYASPQEAAAPSYFSSPLYSMAAIASATSLPAMILPYTLSGRGPNNSSFFSSMRFATTTSAKEILPLSISKGRISRYVQPTNTRNPRIASIAGDLSDFERPSFLENPLLTLLTAGAGISALNVLQNIVSGIQPSKLVAPFYPVMQGLTNASYIYPQSTGGESTFRPGGSSFQGTRINHAQVTSPIVVTTISQNGPRRLNYAESILPIQSNSEITPNTVQSDANRTTRVLETAAPFSSLATPSAKETPIEKVEQNETPSQYEEEQGSGRSYFAPVLMLTSSGLSFPIVQILNSSLGEQRSQNYADSILQNEPSLKTGSDLGENYSRPPAREALATLPISGTTSSSQGTSIEKLQQSLPSEQKIPDALYQDGVSAPPPNFSGHMGGASIGIATPLLPAFIITNALAKQTSTSAINLNRMMTRDSPLFGSSILGRIGLIGYTTLVLNRFLAASSQIEQPILESVSPNFEPAPRVSAMPSFSAEPSLRSRVGMSHVPLAIPGQRLAERSPQLPEERKHPVVKVQGIYDSNARVVKTSEEEEIELRELRRKMATILEEEFRRSYGGS